MPGFNSVLRTGTVVLVGLATSAAAQTRAVLPARIPMNEPFGGSKFAKAIHELSERGELDGQQPPRPDYQPNPDPNPHTYPWHQHHDRSYRCWDPYDEYRYPYGVDGRLRFGVQPASRMTSPAPAGPVPAAPPPEPPSAIEQARLDFTSGDESGAVEGYRAHLAENPDDFEAAAELAVALIAAGRVDDGVAMIRLAYGSDPGLAARPISHRIDLGSREWRGLVVRAVKHAHKRDSGSAWLAVSVLMQAEGRDRIGLRMLDRAERYGLDRSLAAPLAAAMR